MAIFGGEDINAPIITQLMQVDVEDETSYSAQYNDDGVLIDVPGDTELRRFWHRCFAYAHAELTPGIEIRPSYDWEEEFDHATSRAEKMLENLGSEYEWRDRTAPLVSFKKVCLDVQKIFRSLHDDVAVPIRMIRELREYAPPMSIVLDYLDPDEDPEQVNFFQLTAQYTGKHWEPSKFLVRSMDTLLLDIWRGDKRLKRCEDCENIYVAEKERSRFCSIRCKARVGQRRRRKLAEEKEAFLK